MLKEKMDEKTIFISAYRNVSIRYLIYSDIFNTLKAKGYRIVVFLRDSTLEYYKDRFTDEQVHLEPIHYDQCMDQMRKNQLNIFFVRLRRCFSGSEVGEKNITMTYKTDLIKKDLRHTVRTRMEFMLIYLISLFARKFKFIRELIVSLEGILFPATWYDEYFNRYKPSTLISSSLGYMIDPYIMRAAKRNGCKVISIIHSWDNTTTKGYRGASPDKVVVWNSIMKREVSIFHDIPEKSIYEGGIAHWDFYFNGNLKPSPRKDFINKMFNNEKDAKIIFYGTSSPFQMKNTMEVVEDILKYLNENPSVEPVKFLLRLHPLYQKKRQNKSSCLEELTERLERLKSMYPDTLCINVPKLIQLDDDYDMPNNDLTELGEILYHSDVILTEYSTLMIEAAIFDKPVINIGFIRFRDGEKDLKTAGEELVHIQRIMRTGAARCAENFNEFVSMLHQYMEHPEIDREKRSLLVRQEITANKGVAGQKIARFVASEINDKN